MKPYKATHKFPEGLKYENDEVILQLPRGGIQGATKASTSRFGATKTPNFWHSRKQHKLSTPNHPKRNPNYVIAKAKTKTPPKLINDPTQFDNFYWRKNSMKKEYSWPCEKLSLISNVHPLAIIDHPLYIALLKSFLSVHLYVKWTFTWRNSWDVNHNPLMIPLNLLLPQFFVWRKLGTKSGVSYTGVWISSLQIIFLLYYTLWQKEQKV